MNRKIFTLAVLSASLVPFAATAQSTTDLHGTISDEMCAAKHVAATPSDIACAQKCVKGGSPAVLVVGTKVYKIDNQDAVKDHIGHKVEVMGTLTGDTIHIDSVKM
jgi:hypothetical protein